MEIIDRCIDIIASVELILSRLLEIFVRPLSTPIKSNGDNSALAGFIEYGREAILKAIKKILLI